MLSIQRSPFSRKPPGELSARSRKKRERHAERMRAQQDLAAWIERTIGSIPADGNSDGRYGDNAYVAELRRWRAMLAFDRPVSELVPTDAKAPAAPA